MVQNGWRFPKYLGGWKGRIWCMSRIQFSSFLMNLDIKHIYFKNKDSVPKNCSDSLPLHRLKITECQIFLIYIYSDRATPPSPPTYSVKDWIFEIIVLECPLCKVVYIKKYFLQKGSLHYAYSNWTINIFPIINPEDAVGNKRQLISSF